MINPRSYSMSMAISYTCDELHSSVTTKGYPLWLIHGQLKLKPQRDPFKPFKFDTLKVLSYSLTRWVVQLFKFSPSSQIQNIQQNTPDHHGIFKFDSWRWSHWHPTRNIIIIIIVMKTTQEMMIFFGVKFFNPFDFRFTIQCLNVFESRDATLT